jgi:hypothetical protein
VNVKKLKELQSQKGNGAPPVKSRNLFNLSTF